MSVIKSFWVSKEGHHEDECEDSLNYRFCEKPKSGFFVISDGAGEAVFSREWSDALVCELIELSFPIDFHAGGIRSWFDLQREKLNQVWIQKIPPYDSLPWHGQNKFVHGSSATLLAMQITSTGYQAFAVGDSCLFHIRGNDLVMAFPVDHSEAFDTHPYLVHTRYGIPEDEDALSLVEGCYQSGDVFVLATDALSAWLLKEHEAGHMPWPKLVALEDQAACRCLIKQLRDQCELRNDDVALLIIRLDADAEPPSDGIAQSLDETDETALEELCDDQILPRGDRFG